MDHPTPTSTIPPATGTPSPNDSYVARGVATASVGLILGLISLARGVKGGLRGENYAMVGTLLCATSLTITVTLNQALRYMQWDTLPYLW